LLVVVLQSVRLQGNMLHAMLLRKPEVKLPVSWPAILAVLIGQDLTHHTLNEWAMKHIEPLWESLRSVTVSQQPLWQIPLEKPQRLEQE
jgi:hypothetical protein